MTTPCVEADPQPAILAAGVACQPYSRLGDKKGARDPRALSLPYVLQAALVLQSSTVVLECVQQAADDAFVRTCLQTFCAATGFVCQEVKLELSDVWAAHRARWWCILTPPVLGPCRLQVWPKASDCLHVGDVMHQTLPLTAELASLELTRYEVRQLSDRNPLSSYMLQSQGPLPTSLHSTACQVYPCPCGCRPTPFTDERLDRGLVAVITPCHGDGIVGSSRCRHLAPAELALLNGLSPRGPFGGHPRLADCLIGQLASPLQSGWIFAHLRCLVHAIWPGSETPRTPHQVLEAARSALLRDAVEVGLHFRMRRWQSSGSSSPPS